MDGPIRTQSIGITEASFFASTAICVGFYPEMKNAMGLDGLCFYYGALCLANSVWGAIIITDNRGKSLVKVEEEMYDKNLGDDIPQDAEKSTSTTKL